MRRNRKCRRSTLGKVGGTRSCCSRTWGTFGLFCILLPSFWSTNLGVHYYQRVGRDSVMYLGEWTSALLKNSFISQTKNQWRWRSERRSCTMVVLWAAQRYLGRVFLLPVSNQCQMSFVQSTFATFDKILWNCFKTLSYIASFLHDLMLFRSGYVLCCCSRMVRHGP